MVVTGIGVVSAAGWGVDAFRESLRSGETAIRSFDRFDHSRQRTHVAAQVPEDGTKEAKRLSNSDRFALSATSEAISNAALPPRLDDTRAGVFFGSSTGGLFESEKFFDQLCTNPDTAKRGLLASHGISAPAEAVARRFGVCGPVETISSACASATLAIEQAFRAVRDGEVDVAIAGGADCLCRTTYSGFNALRAVDEQPCRPFTPDRAGMSLGEGAAVLVLESAGHAAARQAAVLAEVLGAGSSCDAHHMTAPKPTGEGAAAAIASALCDASLDRDSIAFVNAHATGTPLNDAAEVEALQRVFGDRAKQIPIEVTKSIVGHLLGAAGAIEAVATVLTVSGGEGVGISTNFGFGGANAAVIFGPCDERS